MLHFLLVYFRIICLLILTIFVTGSSYSQTLSHQQYWVDFNPKFAISNKASLTTEIGFRAEPSITIKQTYVRGFANFKLHKNLKLSLGVAEFVTWRDRNFMNTEFRLSQYITITWPRIGGFNFQHRLGMNQRWFTYSESNTNFICRSRYRLGLYSPKFRIISTEKRFYASASLEILRNISEPEFDQWFDHDWITVMVGAQVTKKINIEGHLLLINQNVPETYDFLREVSALRLRVFYSIR